VRARKLTRQDDDGRAEAAVRELAALGAALGGL